MPEYQPVSSANIAAIERPRCPNCQQNRMLLSKLGYADVCVAHDGPDPQVELAGERHLGQAPTGSTVDAEGGQRARPVSRHGEPPLETA